MPNWCTTNYEITGKPSEIKKIKDILKELENYEGPVKNDFGDYWLGNLLCLEGEDPLTSDVRCRGSIVYTDESEDDRIILDVETAWAPMNRVIREYLVKDADVEVSVWAEEPGMGYYASSRSEDIGKYYLSLESYDGEYTTSSQGGSDIQDIRTFLKEELGDRISLSEEADIEEITEALDKLEKDKVIEWYSLHEVSEISFREEEDY